MAKTSSRQTVVADDGHRKQKSFNAGSTWHGSWFNTGIGVPTIPPRGKPGTIVYAGFLKEAATSWACCDAEHAACV